MENPKEHIISGQNLLQLAATYETAAFLQGDPSWFMHQVSGGRNVEAMAFLASVMSYGARTQFLPKIQFFLDCSLGEVDSWVRQGAFLRNIANTNECFYRLYTNHDIRNFLSAYSALMSEYGTLGDYIYVRSRASAENKIEALCAIEQIVEYFKSYDIGTIIPKSTDSACKRLCMFMRWMVRDHSEVDMGQWNFVDKRSLIIPLDTHVLQEAQKLGLIESRTASMSAALRLTRKLAEYFPDDPTRGDFALFGYGVNKSK